LRLKILYAEYFPVFRFPNVAHDTSAIA
jgi:hypothetical protein